MENINITLSIDINTAVYYHLGMTWIAGTVDENFKPEVSISGRGRVGSYSAAKRGGYSRSRQHWVVTFYDGTRSETGYLQQDVTDLGTFKTAKLAAPAAKAFAESKGWTLSGYARSFIHA